MRASLPRSTPGKIWWQDEARIGQKNDITRRWARSGTRPSAPKNQRKKSAYIYGAICPAEGKATWFVLPRCNAEGMTLPAAATIAAGALAVLLLDEAEWHGSEALVVPLDVTLLPLPSKCPELNLVKNVWQFMRDNWLANRIFRSYDDILDHCCFAWNRLVDQPSRIMSIGTRTCGGRRGCQKEEDDGMLNLRQTYRSRQGRVAARACSVNSPLFLTQQGDGNAPPPERKNELRVAISSSAETLTPTIHRIAAVARRLRGDI